MTRFDPDGRCAAHAELGCSPCLRKRVGELENVSVRIAHELAQKAYAAVTEGGGYYSYTDEMLVRMSKALLGVVEGEK